ncbi:MAG: NAD(P)-dependent oxidoreductase [Bryobacteraceae bacterium]
MLSSEQFAAAFDEIHPPFSPQEAQVEANRCLFCFDAPCTVACPTHIDVPRFIKKIASDNLRGSAMTILDANVLGLSCSRVCPVDVLCEGACVMHRYNKQPIEIGRLQRRAMDYFYETGARMPLPVTEPTARSVACIGAGPASLSCAAELRRHGVSVTIFEARDVLGGLNTYGVAEYKFRPADSQKEVEFIRSLGVEFQTGQALGERLSLDRLERDFDAIFVGVGLGPTERLNIPGEDLEGVIDAVRFIADYKLSRRAQVGQRVVVIGGGNTAIDAAIAARLLGAEEVTMAYRRGESEMSAFAFEYEHARLAGVGFLWQAAPLRINGTRGVESMDVTGAIIPCDMVIIAIGQSKLANLLGTDRNIQFSNGRISTDPETGKTANSKYFAGGDCANGGREVVDAVAEGKRAGRAIAKALHG